MPSFFDTIAPLYGKVRPRTRRTADLLATHADFKSTDSVVDLGGGGGAIATLLSEKVANITVVDPSEKMIAQCRRQAGLSCVVGGAEALPFADASIDKVVVVDAFHHMPDQGKAIEEIRRVLKPGGRAILVEYNPATLGGGLIVLMEKVLRLGSTFHRPESLSTMFTTCGFAVELYDRGTAQYCLVAKK